jgi:hypothetical protein
MDINAMSALTAYSYQNTLAQTGSRSQAVVQALATSQAQVAQMGSMFTSAQSAADPLAALASLAGGASSQALMGLSYGTQASAGNGTSAVQSLLSSLNGGVSALLPSSSGFPASAAFLSASTTAALARYAYDQSQNPSSFATQAASSGQQSLLASGWNMLA